MSYDIKCYELAKAFLDDEPEIDTFANQYDLAQSIQDGIDSTIQAMKEHFAHERQERAFKRSKPGETR